MKKLMIFFCLISVVILWSPAVLGADRPNPFGFDIGTTSYQDALKIIQARGWNYEEYEKKQFKRIDEKNPAAGKNTFLVMKPKEMQGSKGIRLFFSSKFKPYESFRRRQVRPEWMKDL